MLKHNGGLIFITLLYLPSVPIKILLFFISLIINLVSEVAAFFETRSLTNSTPNSNPNPLTSPIIFKYYNIHDIFLLALTIHFLNIRL
jgi:hypothetical protein